MDGIQTNPLLGEAGRALAFPVVADSLFQALRREFGSASGLQEVQRDDTSAVYGFAVDGIGYSLMLNRTP